MGKIAAQEAGDLSKMTLAPEVKYFENMIEIRVIVTFLIHTTRSVEGEYRVF